MPLKANSLNIKLSTIALLCVMAFAQAYWIYSVYHIRPEVVFVDAFGSYFLMYGLMLFIRYSPVLYVPKYIKYGIIEVPSLLLTLAWVYFCKYALLEIFPNEPGYAASWQATFFARGIIAWVLICTSIIFHLIFAELYKATDAVQKHQQVEELRKEAELIKLRQQLQPHFLFNSLNSINALINRQPQDARKMVQQLSDYLRNSLRKEDDSFISIQEELSDLRLYLAIEQVRFGHRLIIEEHIKLENERLKIPPFLLQPLVENAIKYGLYGTIGAVHIYIDVRQEKDNLIFSISNPYDKDAVTVKGTGFGLESIKRRLYLLFARNDLLKIEQTINADTNNTDPDLRTFVARLVVPLSD